MTHSILNSSYPSQTTVYTSPQDAPQDASNEFHRGITSITNLEPSHAWILDVVSNRNKWGVEVGGCLVVYCDKNNLNNSKETPVSNCKRGNSNQVQKRRVRWLGIPDTVTTDKMISRPVSKECQDTQLQGNVFLSLCVSYISIDCNLSRVGSSMDVWCERERE